MLSIKWISRADAERACKRWHYSESLPLPPAVYLGVWEDGRWIGAIVFGRGANVHLGSPFGLKSHQVAELCRVALAAHRAPVTQVVAIALRLFHKQSPEVQLVISFADPVQHHTGTIYQAGNWTYTGQTAPSEEWRTASGKRLNKRGFTGVNFGRPRAEVPTGAVCVPVPGKLRYVYAFDETWRARLAALATPYPKRVGPSGPAGNPPAVDGAAPIPTLHSSQDDPGPGPLDG